MVIIHHISVQTLVITHCVTCKVRFFLLAPGNRPNPACLSTNNAVHAQTPTWNNFPFIPLSLSHHFPNHHDATLMPKSTTLSPRWQLLFFLPNGPSVRVRTQLNTILTWKNEGISSQSDRVELNNPPWFFRVHCLKSHTCCKGVHYFSTAGTDTFTCQTFFIILKVWFCCLGSLENWAAQRRALSVLQTRVDVSMPSAGPLNSITSFFSSYYQW